MEWKRYDKDGNIIYEIKDGIKILNEYNNGGNIEPLMRGFFMKINNIKLLSSFYFINFIFIRIVIQ